ncbi:MAG: Hsp20/alpha crystallin family protein [Armatimonadota bacterium]|nr:Hsp20/alpha crystallin family protein [Armatimonadota bacterium]MDR7540549.1 Hsp20/alpha crystallin family protein [Armatimonadota bacterium]MDR7550386.1 Hsp20/alpha crystallin family protein [Armatimonadota bacterium]
MLARRTPFQELFELQRDLMDLFGRFFGSVTRGAADFLANTEALYRNGHLVIRAELAGVDPKSVDVSVAGDTLTIKGERKAPDVPMDDRLFSEIVYGKFERNIPLPEGLDADRVKAVWHNGMLEITIPVSQAIRPRKVPVEIAKA